MFLKFNPQMRERDLRELRGAPLSVYIGIASHMNWDGESFPSLETLSQETGYKVRRVEEALHFLKEEGLITPVKAKRGHSTVYQVNHWFSIGRNGTDALFEKTYALECIHKKNIEEKKKISTYNNSSYDGTGVQGSMAVECHSCHSPDKDAEELWEKVKVGVRGKITKGNYETWVKDTRGICFSDSTLVVGAPSKFVQEHIECFLYGCLLKSAIDVLGRRVELEFQILNDEEDA